MKELKLVLMSIMNKKYKIIILFVVGILAVSMLVCAGNVFYSHILCKRGYAYLQGGDADKAVKEFNKAIKFSRFNYLAYEGRGMAFYEKNLIDEAISNYNASIRIKQNDKTLYYNRGFAFLRKMDLQKAILDFDKSIQLDPKDYKSYVGRGIAFFKEKHIDESINDYNIAIRINKNYQLAYWNRGRSYSSKFEYDKAIDDYNIAIQLDPTSGDVYRDRGLEFIKKSEWKQAVDDFESVIHLNPSNILCYNDYAWLLATCPDVSIRNGAKAVELALKACNLCEWKLWFAIDTLAASYAELGDFNQAVKYQTQLINMDGISEANRAKAKQRLELYREKKSYQENP